MSGLERLEWSLEVREDLAALARHALGHATVKDWERILRMAGEAEPKDHEPRPRVVAAFPATGKSHLASIAPGVVDSDSSAFSWKWRGPDVRERHPDWPGNYIAHLRDLLDGRARLVLVSTHAEVRGALAARGIPFTLVYPVPYLREEYRERMERRGSPPALIAKVIDELWDSALAECQAQCGCEHIVLRGGEYLTDVLHEPRLPVESWEAVGPKRSGAV